MNLGTYLQGVADSLSGKGATDYTETINKILEITGATAVSGGRVPDKVSLGEGNKYERLNYDAPTDEEITATVLSSLEKYLHDGVSAIEKQSETKRASYNQDKVDAGKVRDESIPALGSAYEKAIKSASDDALKRGLARSSIAINTVGAIESDRAKAHTAINDEYARKISELDGKINALESERVKAINDFNIGYTVKLSEEIAKAKAERDEKQTEVVKYNNSLTQKENDEIIERAKAESDLYSESLDQKKAENALYNKPSNAQTEYENQQIYNVLREKLLSMDAITAQKEVKENPIFRNYLTSSYFYRLYDEFGR